MKIQMQDAASWIQAAFVVLLAAIAWLRPMERKRPVTIDVLAAVAIAAIVFARYSSHWLNPVAASALRDWLPVVLLLFPYWQVGQFFTGADPAAEEQLARFDRMFFRILGIKPAKTSIRPAMGLYLELAYLMVYPLIPLGMATLYVLNARQFVNYYWIVVLLATYLCFASTLFVRAMPPRALESYEKFRMPPSKLGALNRVILRHGSIQAITFPSAHVASATAAGLVLLRVEPWAGLIFLLIAVSIALATVVGGYHYAADALVASLVALVVFAATFRTLTVWIGLSILGCVVMYLAGLWRKLRVPSFHLRQARVVAKAMKSRRHPIVAHIVPIRRCNLSCAYCNEYDDFSKPVPTEVMLRRVDCLVELGTSVITISGGEPMLHPDLDQIIRCIRDGGCIATLITNGYLLTPDRIKRLNHSGLDHLQISIDNVRPDDVSKKSLKVLDQKLRWLAEHAEFQVNINSVIGTSENPEDAAAVARRAKELGFATTVGIVHDHAGQLQPLDVHARRVHQRIIEIGGNSFSTFAYYNQFEKNLIEGNPNDWKCRAGSRYLYICEDGLVHYCSQQRGTPGIPLEQYGAEDLEREFHSVKSCAPFCTISCAHQVSMIDQFRDDPRDSLARFFPAQRDRTVPYDPPAIVRFLAWMLLPPEHNHARKRLTEHFTQLALWCLRAK